MIKLAFSGRLRAGKDHLAKEMGCRVVSIADPIYILSEHFLGSSDKDRPDVRKHLQLIGSWGLGLTEEAPEGIPDRRTVTNFIRNKARTVLPMEYHDVAWEKFGQEEGLWVKATLLRTDRMMAESPLIPLAIVNARFSSQVDAFKAADFTHLHVRCSPETRKGRVGPSYDPKMDQDSTELMSIGFDKTLTGKAVVWNDHVAPPHGSDFLSVAEAVAKYTPLSLPPEPAQHRHLSPSQSRALV